jgi:hypothetical protein
MAMLQGDGTEGKASREPPTSTADPAEMSPVWSVSFAMRK